MGLGYFWAIPFWTQGEAGKSGLTSVLLRIEFRIRLCSESNGS